jgi:type III restriction enzyme
MRIKFDAQQPYQLDAIDAIVRVFDGQPQTRGQFEINLDTETAASRTFNELAVGNNLALSEESILDNVKGVQVTNGLDESTALDGMNFTVEMETGTGKTYIYLRTIHELHKKYGFTKFVVVVPSIAIREGVLKNIDITRDHFRTLYDNVPFDSRVYDSQRVSALRQFATSNQLQILVINIDAFNKDTNIIYQDTDQLDGRTPIEFVSVTNPLVILDEPQNLESPQSKAAISKLNPLCTLRYSATHRNPYNLLYRLTPVQAYELNLVKHIEVDSVLEDPDFNQPYVKLLDVKPTKKKINAKLEIDVASATGPQRKSVTVEQRGDDLFVESGEREIYRGYVIERIDAGHNYIAFSNGVTVNLGEAIGDHKDDLMKVQVEETIKEHLEKELAVRRALPNGRRLKVLSLFFIDRVANYVDAEGKIRRWFVEAYQKLSASLRYATLEPPPVADVHDGYFATDNRGQAKDSSGESEADRGAYELIMRDKERLLSPDESLRFIFSHSALREGWDNPNVFQICTLNESRSEIRKRQEIGRGLRIPVDENGERVFDEAINKLTIIANESYADFAKALQKEIESETGMTFGTKRIANARERATATLKEDWQLNDDFQELWRRIRHRTRYSVRYETEELVAMAARLIEEMPPVTAPRISIVRGRLELDKEQGVTTSMLAVDEASITQDLKRIPDVLSRIQRETELTRSTIARTLIASGRLDDLAVNPQQFIDSAIKAVRRALYDLMIDGIKYECVAGAVYEMSLFESREINSYVSKMLDVNKSIYNKIVYDSNPESQFARDLDTREDIKLFFKLPPWFKIRRSVRTIPIGQS